MCGIIGYIGTKDASGVLLNGLSNLEYRGYDSAGVSILDNNTISTCKTKGRISNLYHLLDEKKLVGNIGIGHTRWATHGSPSDLNAHPHLDSTHTISVVHNGIIENYFELKKFLINSGFEFISETDTEVIPNLISYYYNGNLLEAVHMAVSDLKGSFAIAVVSSKEPDKVIAVRKDSPLIIGLGENESYIASDIPAILEYTKKIYLLNDLEYALLQKDSVKIYDKNLNQISKEVFNVTWDACQIDKNGYDDFMLKEIFEQPNKIRLTLESMNLNNLFKDLTIDFSSINSIHIVACGTAMHAGLCGKYAIEELCRIPVSVDVASEFRYRNPILSENTLVLLISQSGETADTLAALRIAKEKGCKTLAICNVVGSSIARECDNVIYTLAGPEIAVASTKAYTSQLCVLYLLAFHISNSLNKSDVNMAEIPSKMETILNSKLPTIKDIAEKIYPKSNIFFIGRGSDYYSALEASLKLKEISYIHSDAYAAGELKHGPIALIENDTYLIAIITNTFLKEKMLSNIKEVKARGAKIILIILDSLLQDIDDSIYDYLITIPDVNYLIAPILSIIPLQLLAYYTAKYKQLDVDKPRNLAKSVTVE